LTLNQLSFCTRWKERERRICDKDLFGGCAITTQMVNGSVKRREERKTMQKTQTDPKTLIHDIRLRAKQRVIYAKVYQSTESGAFDTINSNVVQLNWVN
jgi:hypothetical protein